jgi:hypothetical protein
MTCGFQIIKGFPRSTRVNEYNNTKPPAIMDLVASIRWFGSYGASLGVSEDLHYKFRAALLVRHGVFLIKKNSIYIIVGIISAALQDSTLVNRHVSGRRWTPASSTYRTCAQWSEQRESRPI